MDQFSLDWFKMHLENRFLKSKRDQFQELVCAILERRYPGDFKRIRQGTKKGGGDGGCDGFRTSTGTAYAVYAPRETTSSKLKTKIQGDLEKAKKLLADALKEWIFVHNDPDGINSDEVLVTLQSLRTSNPLIAIGKHIAFEELWALVQELTFDAMCDFLPRPPSATAPARRVTFERIRPVLEHLAKATPSPDVSLAPVSPHKLKYNKLPDSADGFLRLGRRLSTAVADYFKLHPDPELGDKIASGYRTRYVALREQGLDSATTFTELYDFTGGYADTFRGPDWQAAVAAVMAYFFDRCDIFENAPSA